MDEARRGAGVSAVRGGVELSNFASSRTWSSFYAQAVGFGMSWAFFSDRTGAVWIFGALSAVHLMGSILVDIMRRSKR